MKKSIAMEWADLLESGMFKQGKHKLEHKEEYCCLGILCNMAERKGICKVEREEDHYVSFDDERYNLPDSVRRYAGMKSIYGSFKGKDGDILLIDLNDTDNYS